MYKWLLIFTVFYVVITGVKMKMYDSISIRSNCHVIKANMRSLFAIEVNCVSAYYCGPLHVLDQAFL
jgi:hypothetical protein